jgi:hypothetical protein
VKHSHLACLLAVFALTAVANTASLNKRCICDHWAGLVRCCSDGVEGAGEYVTGDWRNLRAEELHALHWCSGGHTKQCEMCGGGGASRGGTT